MNKDFQVTFNSYFSAAASRSVSARYATEEASAAPLIPILGINARSSATVTPSATNENIDPYLGLPRAARSAAITLPLANAMVPGSIHPMTATLGLNRAPKISGTSQGQSKAIAIPVAQLSANT